MNKSYELTDIFRGARKSSELVVLEGFHAIKHALRFDAEIIKCVTSDQDYVEKLIETHASESKAYLSSIEVISETLFQQLSPTPPESKIIAVAKRPRYMLDMVLKSKQQHPIVLLDDPSHPGNVGSVIRVAAAAGAHAVFVTGKLDPWRPQVLRGAQGLHFALPVLHIENVEQIDKPLIVFDERGESLFETKLLYESVFVFGSERRGVSKKIKERAEKIVSIPMQKRVSSINLATSVGIALYATKL